MRDSKSIAAFTVAELGEILPEDYFTVQYAELWSCINWRGDRMREKGFKADTETDARAKCLIYLIKNNLLESEVKHG